MAQATNVRQRLHPEDRRLLLMQASARTFARLGYAGARMEDIAAEAGVAKGLLYQHFPSKEALFEALMTDRGAEFTQRLRASWAATDGSDPWAMVEAGAVGTRFRVP
jgi:AcrR family transcriptional regulator